MEFAWIATIIICAFVVNGYMADCPNGDDDFHMGDCWLNDWRK